MQTSITCPNYNDPLYQSILRIYGNNVGNEIILGIQDINTVYYLIDHTIKDTKGKLYNLKDYIITTKKEYNDYILNLDFNNPESIDIINGTDKSLTKLDLPEKLRHIDLDVELSDLVLHHLKSIEGSEEYNKLMSKEISLEEYYELNEPLIPNLDLFAYYYAPNINKELLHDYKPSNFQTYLTLLKQCINLN